MDNRLIDIHTHTLRPGVISVLSYCIGRDGEKLPDTPYISAGIHPWDAGMPDIDGALSFLETARIAAIGETGLDFTKNIDHTLQAAVFNAQLDMAEKRGLPVIIHCVKAYNEALHILESRNLKAVIFHGYVGSPEQTSRIIRNGYYISIGKTSLGSAKTVASLTEAPLDRIFAETDTDDTPIEEIYGLISDIKHTDGQALQAAISNNFKKIFG